MLGLGIGMVGTVAVANFAQEAHANELGLWSWLATGLAALNALVALAVLLGVGSA